MDQQDELLFKPIGHFHGPEHRSYLLPRQPGPGGVAGKVVLRPDLHQATRDLEGFDRIWLIFQFHRAESWKPMILAPGQTHKRGLFSTRSPHRPNPIGMSCVKLLKVEPTLLHISECDLLDGTPILDIKPYLASSDSYPNSSAGWTATRTTYTATYLCSEKIDWLIAHGGPNLRQAVEHGLLLNPQEASHNRVSRGGADGIWCCQTWRIHFTEQADQLLINDVVSGYSAEELAGPDRWGDIALHISFKEQFSPS